MYKKLFFIFISATFAIGVDLSILHLEKQEMQIYKSQEIEHRYKNEKYNWVNPATITLSTQKTKSATSDVAEDKYNGSITINQDIYRFGGIEYLISYAKANKEVNSVALEIENLHYLEQIYTAILKIKKLKLQLEQSQYYLTNSELDIFLKKEQYKKGIADITSLNNVIIDKNDELKDIIEIEQSITIQQKELAKLTPLPYDKIVIPKFIFLEKDIFMQENYQIYQGNLQSKVTDAQLKISYSDYFPHLTLSSEIGYQEVVNHYDGEYFTMGLKLSLPLDFNKKSTIEQSKIANLKQKVEIEDRKREQQLTYEEIVSNIKNYQAFQMIIQRDIGLYKEIVDITQQGFEKGHKTSYDLQIVQNTQYIDKLEIQIYDMNIELELLKLHSLIDFEKGAFNVVTQR